ncbi:MULTISPECIES: VirB3 family type IV secretion system protein [Xanthomonas translucens group]|uniref:VirB3 family type IV secretion system protein n=1 Tax=Xanthomonas translucens group TaxID=3390202 RepID=UPI0019D7135C|nr:VirB3 family type IV secretion system protein [Xanthomonas translucens]QSQ54770.1 VirB3 family type IV secretion system protein [Xanthomonas translucens pv. undulosa]QSQ62253.1 VirB3 family type IV secretion system protein [Xanthomonas translucens pv. undulosa]WIH07080.1 VirB3 family type IV secretion system protein [Xanthomonas translucens pv. graminis]
MATGHSGRFPLFKGATRLPTFAGVPRTAFLATFMTCATLFLTIHLWALALFALAWFIEFCIAKHDDRIFRIIALAVRTKGLNLINSPFTKKWGGSSYSPIDYEGR